MERPAWLPRSVDPLAPRPRFPPPEGDDRPVNWSIWNEDGSVNVGVIMFAALAGACAAMWTALMVQCARMCRRSAKCPMGYESVAGDEQFVIAGGKPMENPKDVDQPSK